MKAETPGEELKRLSDEFNRRILSMTPDKLQRYVRLFNLLRAPEVPNGTELAVCRDIAERQKLGVAKYGVTVADNPLELREWLQHAYEECLDQAVYLRRAMDEWDESQSRITLVTTEETPHIWSDYE